MLETPTSGQVIFEGSDLTKASVKELNRMREKMGMVFQHFNLFPHLTIKKNITIAPVKLKLMSESEANARAEELLKKNPDALLDIHRDAVPAEEYETEVDGEDVSKVRLFVGRNNQNSAENKAFAQQIKAEADKEYPGLIKDIFIGKGNYNQELYPHALLMEFGTHEIEKEKAEASTDYIAEVLDNVLYGPSAKAEGAKGATGKGVAKGVGWVVGLALVAAAVYGLAATGSLRGAWEKVGRNVSEITGGLLGKKPGKGGK
jgi:stage II sporulation protein P